MLALCPISPDHYKAKCKEHYLLSCFYITNLNYLNLYGNSKIRFNHMKYKIMFRKRCRLSNASPPMQAVQCLPSKVGLPPVPFSAGRPGFQPVCPASRYNVCRDAICPAFWAFAQHDWHFTLIAKYSNNIHVLLYKCCGKRVLSLLWQAISTQNISICNL